MTRFEQKSPPALHAAIAIAATIVFIADLATPLGVAVWIVYLVPVVLTLFLHRPAVPLLVASAITVMMIVGFYLSPPGVNLTFAKINRALGGATIWVIAAVAYTFIQNKLLVQKEEWIKSGQTGVSEVVRGEHTPQQMGEAILRFLAQHLEAHAGAFFVEENGSFRRVASYALPQHSGVPERVAPGEGLIGQAVKDARTCIVDDVPDGYFAIGSGLGRSRPRHLLIAPLKADGIVNSVLELGLVHPVYKADSELMARVAESIGIAVRTSKDRMRLHELLEETQRQAEELQAQTEELRVANEELAEQSRALTDSQTRLELQQTELEQTNQQLAQQAAVLEQQKDELTRAKLELEQQASELALASRYKSDFMANMSHELRTPLNSSLILAKLLSENRQGNLTPEQVKYAQTIESAGNDLLALITDILDLSKIEAGRMELNVQKVPLRNLLDNVRRTFEPMAAHKGLQFRVEAAPNSPHSLETDPQRVEQVLKNMLANAVKFTERGEVSLQVGRRADGWIEFAVRDTGIGIPAHQQQIIFEPFRQADGTTNRKYGGTGLGLSIARQLADLLGATIQVSSQPGQGSTFTLSLPEAFSAKPTHPPAPGTGAPTPSGRDLLSPVSARSGSKTPTAISSSSTPAAAPTPVSPVRFGQVADDRDRLDGRSRVILVVEDDKSFAGIIYDLAHEEGFQCLIATTAEEGLSLARQFHPSAIALDIGLPDNSGLSVLDRLKAEPRTRHIPVHVISASDHSHAALGMGAAGYMLKPVKREQLVEAFKQLETRLTQKIQRVLVIEDDPVQLESLRRLLDSRAVETVGAHTAAECLDILKNTRVDCMVLDLNLPDASGLSLLETLSHEETYPFPPVIIYTGRDLTAEEERQLRKYSSSIIIKGAKSPERLLDEVTLFLHQVVSDLSPEQQRLLAKARSRDAALEGKRILIVEDDVRNVFAVTSILEPRGATVQIARNGKEALQMLSRTSTTPDAHIDLVLMDIMMPEMDGLTAMREIRKRPEWKKLPIIALTAKAMKTDQEESFKAGANDYMAKPLDVEKLLSLVRVWVAT